MERTSLTANSKTNKSGSVGNPCIIILTRLAMAHICKNKNEKENELDAPVMNQCVPVCSNPDDDTIYDNITTVWFLHRLRELLDSRLDVAFLHRPVDTCRSTKLPIDPNISCSHFLKQTKNNHVTFRSILVVKQLQNVIIIIICTKMNVVSC